MCDYIAITYIIKTTTEHIRKYIYFNEHRANDNNEKKQFIEVIAKREYNEIDKENYYKKNKDKFKNYYINNKNRILEQQGRYKAFVKEQKIIEESKNYKEQYKINVKELKTEQSKYNYVDNENKILELQKKYKNEQKKAHYQIHKEEIKERRRLKYQEQKNNITI